MQTTPAKSFLGQQLLAAIKVMTRRDLSSHPIQYLIDENIYWAALVDNVIYLWK